MPASSSTPIEAVWSSNGRFVAHRAQLDAVTVVDRLGGSATYQFEQLRPPSVTAAYVSGVFGISDDGRYFTYSLRFRSTVSAGYTTMVRMDRDTGEFATRVSASAPIVAERAIYRDAQGQLLGAGSNAVGATTPSTTWSFAEGATGDFFDTFILVANTGQTAVDSP